MYIIVADLVQIYFSALNFIVFYSSTAQRNHIAFILVISLNRYPI